MSALDLRATRDFTCSVADESPKGDAKSLASSILSQVAEAPEAEPGPTQEVVPRSHEEIAQDAMAMMEVYFDLEEPDERDALLDELAQIKQPVVTEFFAAVLEQDEDDYVRAAAAAELARRREPAGIEALQSDLEDPEEAFFFENAVKTLCEIHGVGFYDTLAAMWRDPDCDGDKRREVMLGMELLDLQRSLKDFVSLVEQTIDVNTMQDDQIEVAIMAFLRHNYTDALGPLRELLGRVQSADIDPDERVELSEFVKEGIDMLAAQDG